MTGLTVYLIVVNIGLRRSIAELDTKKETEFKTRLAQEKEFVKRDMEEKYRADMVSFEALAKRLELEKRRLKETEEKLNKIKSKTQNSEPDTEKK